jgi:predicted metalloendopeptidase
MKPCLSLAAWYSAFGLGPDDKLYVAPQDRVHI